MQIKILIAKFIRKCLFWTELLLVKENRILFFSYQGKNYSCNPKYIVERLIEQNLYDLDIFYAFSNKSKYYEKLSPKINLVKYGSFYFYYLFFTSKIIVTNSSNLPYLPKKKNQILINTWHGGGAYKTELYNLDLTRFKNENVDYFISSSQLFHKLIQASNGLSDDKFLDVGMPRNDFLIQCTPVEVANIKHKIGLENEVHYLLYAPTYREVKRDISYPNFEEVLELFSKKFSGKWKMILRGHYNCIDEFKSMGLEYIDLSSYDDMQEVLAVSDAVITDYSSLIWDYSFLNRPCFLYVPDLGQYEQERGFYYPLQTWGFPYATNMAELSIAITKFNNEEFYKKMEKHHKEYGSYENGNATEKVVEVMLDIIKRG